MLLNRKTRSITAAIAAGLVLSLSACGQSSDSASSSSAAAADEAKEPTLATIESAHKLLPDDIAEAGVIKVAIPTNEPPTQFYREGTETMTGINPDIARLLAGALGVEIQIEVTNFDSIIPGIEAGRYDMTVSSMSPTEERIESLDFVDYMNMGSALAVAQGNPQKLDFDTLCGKRVAVLTGSYQLKVYIPERNDECEEAGKPALDIQQFQDTRQAISSLASGRSDAVYADGPILSFAATQNPDIEVPDNNSASPVAVGIVKGTGLTEAVKAAMDEILLSPEYQEVLESYGVESMAIDDARVNFAQ